MNKTKKNLLTFIILFSFSFSSHNIFGMQCTKAPFFYLYSYFNFQEDLSDFHRLPDDIILNVIFEFISMKDLENISKTNNRLNRIFKKYSLTNIIKSDKTIYFKISAEDEYFGEKIRKIKKKVTNVMKNSKRKLEVTIYKRDFKEKIEINIKKINKLEILAAKARDDVLYDEEEAFQQDLESFLGYSLF